MKILKYVVAVVILLVVGAVFAYPNVGRLVFIGFSDFRFIGNNVYVSQELAADDEKLVVSILAGARERIAGQYGEPKADPLVIVLGNQAERESYGLYDRPGMLLFVPWGGYLLLSHDEAGIDVAAHELVHAELVDRVGYLKRQLDIPTWLDEGAGMQVDYRPQYSSLMAIDKVEFERVLSLSTVGEFWSNDKQQNRENYRGAKAAVAALFKNSNESLYSLLSKIRSGNGSVLSAETDRTSKLLSKGP